MRILVVDDDLVSRKNLHFYLSPYGWCRAVDNGFEALELLKGASGAGNRFDLVVLDLLLPEKSGLEVLVELRAAEEKIGGPHTKVIIISSKADQDSFLKCVQAGCDDYVVKPFEKKTLEAKMKRLGFFHPADDHTRHLICRSQVSQAQKVDLGVHLFKLLEQGKLSLPSPPDIFIRFRELMAKQASGALVADLLKQDASVSLKLISVSNSLQYRGVSENTTVEQAIGRLGMAATRKYVYLICGQSMYAMSSKRYDEQIKQIWRHSVVCAHGCEVLSECLGVNSTVDPFTLGILHDIGKLALIQFVDKLEQNQTLPDLVDEEELNEILARHHGSFGEVLLKKWGFPRVFTEAARLHQKPPQDASSEVWLVWGAEQLCFSLERGYDGPLVTLPESVIALGLDIGTFMQAQKEMKSRLELSLGALEDES